MPKSFDSIEANPKSPPGVRNLVGRIVVLGVSAAPLVVTFVAAKSKIVRLMIGYAEMPLFFLLSFLSGFYWYRALTGQFTAKQRAARAELGHIDRGDKFALIAALILGLSIGVFLLGLNSHQMVRAFDAAWPANSEDD